MGRTSKIYTRIRRNLGSISDRDLKSKAIYQQIQEAQTQIIALTDCLEKEFSIETVNDQESYELLYTATVDEQEVFLPIIGEIKSIITPSTYSGKITPVPENEYNQFKELITIETNPIYATVFDNQIHFWPVPISSGDIIKFWIYLTDSITKITSDAVEPEIQGYWDKALEYFATAQFLQGEPSVYFMQMFNAEIAKFEGKPHAKYQGSAIPDADW